MNDHTSLSSILSTFRVSKFIECSDLKQIIFDVLHSPWSSVLDQIVHGIQSLKYLSPVLGFWIQFGPQVFHYHRVVIPKKNRIRKYLRDILVPIVGVISEDLQLWVWYVPVLIRGTFLEHFLILIWIVNLIFTIEDLVTGSYYILLATLYIEFIIQYNY